MSALDLLRNFTLGDVVRENARSSPRSTALVCAGDRWTFAETHARVNALASSLASTGVSMGSRVLWLGQNCHRALETLLACAKLGAVFVPANWRQSAEEMIATLTDSEPSVVVWQDTEIGERVTKARATSADEAIWIRHDASGPDTLEALVEQGSATDLAEAVSEDSPVVQMYTAAFEGRPRGALLTHRNLILSGLQLALVQRLSFEDVHLASMPFFHILGLLNALATFHVGATNVITRRVDGEEMCRLVASERVTRAVVIGPTVAQMIDAVERGGYDISSLRTQPGAGGPNAKRWAELTSPTLLPMGGYGQTEIAGQATFDAYGGRGSGSHGHPAPLAIVRIVGEDGLEVPDGSTGEIVVRSPTVMAGYADGGDKERDGWHHTGDLGTREPDGSVSFLGPKTDLIKTGAENVYPAEVEAVFMRHKAVKEVCVFGIPDPTWRQAVKAVIALREGATVTVEELIEHCRKHIAGYKKPREIELVVALPRTPSGAIDREETKRRYGAKE